jgi:uncharacterized spore protein YtfJ
MSRLRVSEVWGSAERSILAIEQVDSLMVEHVSGAGLSVSIRPVALVVREDRRVHAFDLESKPVDLDWLCDRNPGLDLALAAAVAAQEGSA